MKNASKKMIDYYELLEIDPKADVAGIKRAYHEKLKIWHPDKNVGNTEAAEEKTKLLNQAYSVLSDPAQRKQYDRILRYTRGKDFSRVMNEREFWRKVEKASPALKHILEDLKDLYGLFIDAIKGRYKLHPALLGMIGGGLLYFIIPLDFIPDYIPIVGLLDDFAVLSAIINSMQEELLEYRKSKAKYN
ncbi:MAG: DnaJ domain-containing protein [Desulfobacterales bacterium]|nr:DnaJ domain-containing protein [Desulfobacterales bacterium]